MKNKPMKLENDGMRNVLGDVFLRIFLICLEKVYLNILT